MRERDFQAQVIEVAQLYGWRVAHFRAAMAADGRYMTPVAADGAGFPDLVLAHPHRRLVLYRELKSTKGRLTLEQAQWGTTLMAAGADWGVWRPNDWALIVDLLTDGRGIAAS